MKAALGFIALAAVAGLLIGITRDITRNAIAANEAAAQAAILNELLGGTVDPDASNRLCRGETRGYAGTIQLLVLPRKQTKVIGTTPAITPALTIEAVRVLRHSETPGIGDFIDLSKSPWINQFSGLATTPQPRTTITNWEAKIDAVSGATITRRAVIKGIAEACPEPSPATKEAENS